MNDREAIEAGNEISLTIARHALTWLTAGCGLGLATATLLAFPGLGVLLGSFGYGRLMALHLDLTLYGWLALPLIGILMRFFSLERFTWRARWAVRLWSVALVAGAASVLAGRTGGKLFLDWTGGARAVFLAATVVLFIVLLSGARERWRREPRSRLQLVGVLVVLALVPPALFWATRAGGYPAVNPASGGPTGTSLLGSTLVLALILLAVPRLARLPRRSQALLDGRVPWVLWICHSLVFLALAGPDRANHEASEVLALGSALLWAVVVPFDLAGFDWPRSTRRWRQGALGWGIALALAGFVQFLPGPLAAAKFTHWLVAHAHLAMAGFASSAAFVFLDLGAASGSVAGSRAVFVLWQGGTLLHVAALAGVGSLEVADPAVLLRGSFALSAWLALRWLAGAAMLAGAWSALRCSWEAA